MRKKGSNSTQAYVYSSASHLLLARSFSVSIYTTYTVQNRYTMRFNTSSANSGSQIEFEFDFVSPVFRIFLPFCDSHILQWLDACVRAFASAPLFFLGIFDEQIKSKNFEAKMMTVLAEILKRQHSHFDGIAFVAPAAIPPLKQLHYENLPQQWHTHTKCHTGLFE